MWGVSDRIIYLRDWPRLGMLIGMIIGVTVPKIKKKERTWQQK